MADMHSRSPDPGRPPETAGDDVAHHTARLASRMRPHLGELTDAVYEYLAQRITDLAEESELLEMMRASTEANIASIFHALEQGVNPRDLAPPSAAVDYARRLAQRGISVNALLRAYRLGQQKLLQRAYDFVVDDDELPPDTVAAVYQEQVDAISEYIDWISQNVADHYEQERESWLANRATARETHVRRILSGEDVDRASTEQILGCDIDARHLGVIAWTPPASDHAADQLGRFTAAIRKLAHALDSTRAALIIGRDQGTAWGWIPVGADWTYDSGLREHFDVDAGSDAAVRHGSIRLAIGSAHWSAAGFRLTHDEAARVQLVCLAGRSEDTLASHDEWGMGSASLLVKDLEGSLTWVRSVLGPIAEDTEANARHRLTLREFLRHDLSYTATAAAMSMHKNSIRYRVEMAEAAMGNSISTNRLDVETALCAHDYLVPVAN